MTNTTTVTWLLFFPSLRPVGHRHLDLMDLPTPVTLSVRPSGRDWQRSIRELMTFETHQREHGAMKTDLVTRSFVRSFYLRDESCPERLHLSCTFDDWLCFVADVSVRLLSTAFDAFVAVENVCAAYSAHFPEASRSIARRSTVDHATRLIEPVCSWSSLLSSWTTMS